MTATIRALATNNIEEMQGLDDEAIYEIGILIDVGPHYLKDRARHLLRLAEQTNYNSIESRNLWQEQGWLQTVYDLLMLIDREVERIIADEEKIDEVVKEVAIPIHQQAKMLEEMKVDGRWTDRTAIIHARELIGASELDDEEILEILYPEEIVYYEDNQLSNIEYIKQKKERRNL